MPVAEDLRQDKRRDARLNIDLAVSFRHKDSPQAFRSVIKHLSNRGLKLIVDNCLPKGSSLLLGLGLKELPQILNISGRVAWVKNLGFSNRYHIGVEFLDLNKETKGVLEQYLNVRAALN